MFLQQCWFSSYLKLPLVRLSGHIATNDVMTSQSYTIETMFCKRANYCFLLSSGMPTCSELSSHQELGFYIDSSRLKNYPKDNWSELSSWQIDNVEKNKSLNSCRPLVVWLDRQNFQSLADFVSFSSTI